jgi:outer membrane biosynthesis protein TonB
MELEKYYARVTGKIDQALPQTRIKNERGEVEVEFTLSRSGELLDEPFILRSTNPNLKIPAQAAIKSAAPFGPFPKSLNKEKNKFKITLYYQ